MVLTSNIHEIGKVDLKEAQRMAWDAIPKSGRNNYLLYRGRQKCIEMAQSKALPGESRGAFLNNTIKVADKIVHRIVPRHFVILTALDSPMLKMMEQVTAENKSEAEWTAQQEWEVCYIFTHEPKEVFQIFKAKGADEIKRLAEDEVGDWDAAVVRFVTVAVLEQLKRHVETKVKIATELEKTGDISFFRERPAQAEKPSA
jgi:hypothetical protein